MKNLWKLVASFFGLGFSPAAPGTVASLGVVLLYKYSFSGWRWPQLLVLLLALFILGGFAATAYSRELGQGDPRRVVVDEAAGQLLVLFGVSPAWLFLFIGFFLFRLFDILKPFPIRRLEKLPLGWGIMADDLAAAVMAKALLHLYLYLK